MPPLVGIALMSSDAFRAAVTPLVQDGLVDALERTIDAVWVDGTSHYPEPRWVDELVELYAEDGCVYGHGVWWSGFSAQWHDRQARWLEHLAAECRRRP